MDIRFEIITPMLAKAYLTSNTSNRSIRETAVEEYASEMRAGRWKKTHQGIAFDTNGALVDGQHRLLAVVKSGVSVELAVTRGVEADTQDVVDAGRKRTTADQLMLRHGVKNANLTAASARSIALICGFEKTSTFSIGKAMSVLEVYGPEIQETIGYAMHFKSARKAPVIAAISFALKSHGEEVREFVSKLVSGDDLKKGSPILTLRNYLINAAGAKGGAESLSTSSLVLHAIYHHITGGSVQVLRKSDMGAEFFKAQQQANVANIQAAISQPISEHTT